MCLYMSGRARWTPAWLACGAPLPPSSTQAADETPIWWALEGAVNAGYWAIGHCRAA